MVIDPKYGPLRRHQVAALELARAIDAGEREQKFFQAAVAPGYGKSLMFALFATELLSKRIVTRLLVVVPRDPLRSQMVQAFKGLPYSLIEAKGDRLPYAGQLRMDGVAGIVTTYQSLLAHPEKYAKMVGAANTLVCFDENHHLVENVSEVEDPSMVGWSPAASLVYEAATLAMGMSGSLMTIGKRVKFVRYADRIPQADIIGSRRDALDERAVLPIIFQSHDGDVEYTNRDKDYATELSTVAKKEEGRALSTAFGDGSEYRDALVVRGIQEWQAYRALAYRSRAIIIADTQGSARHYAKLVRERFNVDVSLAISDEKDGPKRLKRFRDAHEGDVLVTVGMAYEGLDVPDCTHLICATKIRSEAWLEQAFARVTRFNAACGRPWEEQQAYIYLPDDPSMSAFLERLKSEQAVAYDEQTKRAGLRLIRGHSSFIQKSAEATSERYSSLEGSLSSPDNEAVGAAREAFPECIAWPLVRQIELGRCLLKRTA